MKTLQMALPLVMLVGWGVGAGCDDDRPVADLGAGGDVTQPGGAAGKAGAGGDETAPGGAGAGVTLAGAGGAAGGAGGAAGGAGGAAECPADIFEAEGTACTEEGMGCGDGGGDPCQFGQFIVCLDGKWEHQEAFPAPCGGAGGQASSGGAGAGGAP